MSNKRHNFDYFTNKCDKCGVERRPAQKSVAANLRVQKMRLEYEYRQEGGEWGLNYKGCEKK